MAKGPRSGTDNMIEVDGPKSEQYRNHAIRRYFLRQKQEITPGLNRMA